MPQASGTTRRGWSAQRMAGRGFTLIELIVSVTVVAVLIAILIVGVSQAVRFASTQAATATARNLGVAVNQFETENSFLPPLVHDGAATSAGTTGGAMVSPQPIVNLNSALVPTSAGPLYDLSAVPGVTAPANTLLPAVFNTRFDTAFLRGRDRDQAPPATFFPDDSTRRAPPRLAGTNGSMRTERYDYETGTDDFLQANQRYSKNTLAYYLIGALPAEVDGVSGAGTGKVLSSGAFQIGGSRTTGEPFFDPDGRGATLVTDYIDPDEFREHEAEAQIPADLAIPNSQQFGLVDGNGKAFRYYRWEHEPDVVTTHGLNIPSVLLDPAVVGDFLDQIGTPLDEADPSLDPAGPQAAFDLTDGDTRLRAATWAIVGAGRDGLFGTEPIEIIWERYGRGPFDPMATAGALRDLRARAAEDNLVEYGR